MSRSKVATLRWLPTFAFALALGGAALTASDAQAGKVRFGAEPLDVDDAGKLTDAGQSASTTTLASLPGEEIWPLHVWAQLDKGAPGPLYVEFFGKLPGSGKRYLVWRHEHASYEGGKFVSIDIELDGNSGFNRDRTYAVELNQLNDKGKNVKLASGSLSLSFTEAEPEEEENDGDDEGEEDLDEQDVLDSFAGDNGEEGDEAPPEITPPAKKKGCHVDPRGGAAPGVLVLLMLGMGLARRRRF